MIDLISALRCGEEVFSRRDLGDAVLACLRNAADSVNPGHAEVIATVFVELEQELFHDGMEQEKYATGEGVNYKERLEACERYLGSTKYPDIDSICAILGIAYTKE